MSESPDYLLCFYVPKESAAQVKQAIFVTGAGSIGEYECCAWETEGRGQFKPREKANPAIGKIGEIEHVEELKVELVCQTANIRAAVQALKKSHPYEEPAYHVVKFETGF